MQVWWRSGHLPARRSGLRKSLQMDGRIDRRTDDGRLAIVLAHSWNELKTTVGWLNELLTVHFLRLQRIDFFWCICTHCIQKFCAYSWHSHLKIFIHHITSPSVGDRAFGVAAAPVWNSLPLTVHSATSLNTTLSVFIQPLTLCFKLLNWFYSTISITAR